MLRMGSIRPLSSESTNILKFQKEIRAQLEVTIFLIYDRKRSFLCAFAIFSNIRIKCNLNIFAGFACIYYLYSVKVWRS